MVNRVRAQNPYAQPTDLLSSTPHTCGRMLGEYAFRNSQKRPCQGPRSEAPGSLLRLRVAPLAAARSVSVSFKGKEYFCIYVYMFEFISCLFVLVHLYFESFSCAVATKDVGLVLCGLWLGLGVVTGKFREEWLRVVKQ